MDIIVVIAIVAIVLLAATMVVSPVKMPKTKEQDETTDPRSAER